MFFQKKQVGTHNKVGDLLMEGQNISMIMMITCLQITRTDNYDLSDENWYREETGVGGVIAAVNRLNYVFSTVQSEVK